MQTSLIFATMIPMLKAKLQALESEVLEIEVPGIDINLTGTLRLLDENGVTSKTITVSVSTAGGKGTMRLWSI